jgi:hypothetical protein
LPFVDAKGPHDLVQIKQVFRRNRALLFVEFVIVHDSILGGIPDWTPPDDVLQIYEDG